MDLYISYRGRRDCRSTHTKGTYLHFASNTHECIGWHRSKSHISMAFDDWSSQTTSFLPAFRILTSNHQRRSLTRRWIALGFWCHQRSASWFAIGQLGPLARGGRPGESRRWSETSWRLDKDGAAVDPMALFGFVSRMGHPESIQKLFWMGNDEPWWTSGCTGYFWMTPIWLVWTSEALPNLAFAAPIYSNTWPIVSIVLPFHWVLSAQS